MSSRVQGCRLCSLFYQAWKNGHYRTDSLDGCSFGCRVGRQLWPAPSCGGDAGLGSGHVMDAYVFLETIGFPCQMCIFELTCDDAFAVDHDVPGLAYRHVHHTWGSWSLHYRP